MYNKRERVGTMRHRIKFMKPIKGRDEYGGESREWIVSADVWANIDYQQSGSDLGEEATRRQAFTKAVITVRYAGTVWAGMRIKADSREFIIESVLPDVKREYMEMECTIDGPREQEYVAASGQPWELPGGGAWLVADDGDVKDEPAATTTHTDSAGLEWNVPAGSSYTDEDGNPETNHAAGDVKDEPSGRDEWTETDSGITWNPS